jgi:hypothetical protein
MIQEPTTPGDIGRLQTWPPEAIPCIPDMTKTDPCSGCAWRENLLKDGLYIGDTPCTWCNKNKFNSITSSTPPLTGTVQGVSKLETYLTPSVDCLDAYTKPEVDKKLQEVYDTMGCTAINQGCGNNQGDYAVGQLNACPACTSNQNKCGDTEGHNSCSGEHKCGGKKTCKGKH